MKRRNHRPMEMLENRLLMSVIPVTSNADTGSGSLRDAITAASAGDTIDLTGVRGTITLASEIGINKDLTITGPGAATLSLDGNNANRMFNINSGTVTISGLTFAHGFDSFEGGAIISYGNLTLDACAFTNNRATADITSGGAVYTNTGSLSISNCTFSSNSAVGTVDFESLAEGGAIWSSVATHISNSTFTGNLAQAGVGEEIAEGSAGAIWLSGSGNTITNCTIANNQAAGGPMGSGFGGGINGDATITNSIIAHNTADNGADLYGTYTTGGHNLIGTSATGFANGTKGDLVSIDPMLNALADNGGPTQTMSLQSGSPAINAGHDAAAPITDQRGAARVGTSDIGAFEYGSSVVNHAPTFSSTAIETAYSGTQYTYDISAADSDSDTMTITAPTLPGWLTLTDNGDGTATISGTPVDTNFGSNPVALQVSDGKEARSRASICRWWCRSGILWAMEFCGSTEPPAMMTSTSGCAMTTFELSQTA